MSISYTYGAREKLKREADIKTLFRTGKAFSVPSLRIIYRFCPRPVLETAPSRAGVSVSKKNFKKATCRNKIKRLLREGWRHLRPLADAEIDATQQLHLFIIFTGKKLPASPEISQAFLQAGPALISVITIARLAPITPIPPGTSPHRSAKIQSDE